jgi:2-polyprenyl-3-methyl-5-hydroxy-6-metoxy-1,4-benzoquinol methylase
MTPDIDALTSPTLKHLRERWWNDEFTEFLAETLKPRAGNRILDVGCGIGIGEVSIGRLHVSQLRLYGVDLVAANVAAARQATLSSNMRAGFAAGDACHLPFKDAAFDSTYCVAVLQHIRDIDAAAREFARVTVPGGRVIAVEPDNGARYFYSSTPSGRRAALVAAQFFAALSAERGDATDPSIGPKVPTLFARFGIEPIDVRLFPVSQTQLGAPPAEVWLERRTRIERALAQAKTEDVKGLGREYLLLLNAYEAEAMQAGSSFIEIQNTMLFATVGQRSE